MGYRGDGCVGLRCWGWTHIGRSSAEIGFSVAPGLGLGQLGPQCAEQLLCRGDPARVARAEGQAHLGEMDLVDVQAPTDLVSQMLH